MNTFNYKYISLANVCLSVLSIFFFDKFFLCLDAHKVDARGFYFVHTQSQFKLIFFSRLLSSFFLINSISLIFQKKNYRKKKFNRLIDSCQFTYIVIALFFIPLCLIKIKSNCVDRRFCFL